MGRARASASRHFCTEAQARAVDRCLQLFGGYGCMLEYPIARLYAYARITRIHAGTSEVMKVIIAKSPDCEAVKVPDFSSKVGVAFVAGGSGGIGAAIVRLLAERGSDIVLTYRANQEAADAVAAEVTKFGRQVRSLRLDLTDESATAEAVSETADGIHTLVYAAGPHVPMRHLSTVTPSEYRAQLEGDAMAFFNLVHPALPLLRESRGSIVAVTTVATRRFPVRDGLSSGAKGAVEAVARALAAEEGRYGVRVNCVAPACSTTASPAA